MNLTPWKSRENWLDPFESMDKEMERLFNWSALRGNGKNRLAELWNPAVDIFDEKDQIRVKADIPGLEKDQIEISAEEGVLTIKGEKKEETKPEAKPEEKQEEEQREKTFDRQQEDRKVKKETKGLRKFFRRKSV